MCKYDHIDSVHSDLHRAIQISSLVGYLNRWFALGTTTTYNREMLQQCLAGRSTPGAETAVSMVFIRKALPYENDEFIKALEVL